MWLLLLLFLYYPNLMQSLFYFYIACCNYRWKLKCSPEVSLRRSGGKKPSEVVLSDCSFNFLVGIFLFLY